MLDNRADFVCIMVKVCHEVRDAGTATRASDVSEKRAVPHGHDGLGELERERS